MICRTSRKIEVGKTFEFLKFFFGSIGEKTWLQKVNLNSHPNVFIFLKSILSSFITKLS